MDDIFDMLGINKNLNQILINRMSNRVRNAKKGTKEKFYKSLARDYLDILEQLKKF